MTSTTKIGQQGESGAAEFLATLGFRLEARNVQTGRGEIDIIAWEGEVLCFIEVKARSHRDFGGAASAVNATKQQRLWKSAEAYLALKEEIWHAPPECRFDVVTVLSGSDSRSDDRSQWEYALYRNAFSPGAAR